MSTMATVGLAAPASAEVQVGPFNIDVSDREQVRAAWYTIYQSSENIDIGWTGNHANCVAGEPSAEYLAATLSRVNYYRAMAGVPSNVVINPAAQQIAQETALAQSANSGMTHNVPADWRCRTQNAVDGAATANLAGPGPGGIDGYVRDGGPINTHAGHRRSMLNPIIVSLGLGNVGNGPGLTGRGAMHFGDERAPARPATRTEYVAWPPAGFSPYQIVHPRWSFALPNGDFSAATVTMSRAGVNLGAQIESRADWAGPGIVWIPGNITQPEAWPRPATDETFTVTVANVIVNGAPQSFTYDVTVFDPSVPDPDNTPAVITGPDTAPTAQATTYTVNPLPAAAGYQWRTTTLPRRAFTAGAENGLGDFEAVTSEYNPISTEFAATGTSSFRLTAGQGAGPSGDYSQLLTLNRAIVPSATSVLTFKSRAILFDNVLGFVEASTDSGTTWTTIHSNEAARQTEFADHHVSLAPFAEQLMLLRFRVAPSFATGWFMDQNEGWYLDDINIANASTTEDTLSAVGAGPSFAFIPTANGTSVLSVRAQYFGSGFGEWSAPKRITTGTGPDNGGGPVTPPTATTLASALDADSLAWTVASDAAWTAQSDITHDGIDAAMSAPATHNETRTIQTTVAGPATVSFWWKVSSERGYDLLNVTLNGDQAATPVSGEVDWEQRTIAIPAGEHTLAFSYTKDGSVSNGQDRGWIDEITIGPPLPPLSTPSLADAVDTMLPVTIAGDSGWTAQRTVSHDDTDAAASGNLTHGESSLMTVEVAGPVAVSFWWKVSSERGYDFLSFTVDGNAVAAVAPISGEVDWIRQTVDIPAGTHTVAWTYTKDGSVTHGQDRGWVDQIFIG